MKRARFRVYEDKGGQWRWRLLAANGRVVADSSEGYGTRYGASRAVEMVRSLAVTALSVKEEDPEVVVLNPLVDVSLPSRKPH
jgi:uncharacterized protein YegP (UPF0339 family)